MRQIVQQGSDYIVAFDYSPTIISDIKLIPGRRFDYTSKNWVVPASSRRHLETLAARHRFSFQGTETPSVFKNFTYDIPEMPTLAAEIPLKRDLFPFQRQGVQYILDKKRVIVGDQPGLGKAQPLTAKIATPNGWMMMGEMSLGQKVFGKDGNIYEVRGVYPQGTRFVYRVTLNDGFSVECDLGHLWCVRDVNRRRRNSPWTVKSLNELLDRGLTYNLTETRKKSGRKAILKWEIPIAEPVQYPSRNFVIHPYLMGLLLGDGSLYGKGICISIPDSEEETVGRIKALLPSNLKLTVNRHPACPQYFITQTGTTHKNPFSAEIERLGLNVKGKNKFVPVEYLTASVEQREELLKGLMDSDGSAMKNRITFHSCSRGLVDGVTELVQSLGGQVIVREYDRSREGKSMEWQVNVRIGRCPFNIQRKADQWRAATRNYASRYIQSVEYVREDEVQCIEVSAPDNLYLTDNYTVTHNTAQAIAALIAADTFPALIICPSSLKENWRREVEMWTSKTAMILNDSIRNTWSYFYEAKLADIFIVNYESLKKYFVAEINQPVDAEGKKVPLRLNHVKFSNKINLFKAIVCDESHRVKDIKTQQAKFTKGVCAGKEYIFLLTGTPVVNKPRDLVSQLGILDRLKDLGGYKNFEKWFCEADDRWRELNVLLRRNCFYRREKSDVLKDLPAKMRQAVICDITTRREYNDALTDLADYLKRYKQATDEQIQRSMRGEIMVRIGALKNISARGKIADVVDYVSNVVDAGEKIILFTHLREVQQQLKTFFPAAVTIIGDDDMATRQRNVDAFQNDPRVQVIICSIKAAGVGLTLTASSRMAFVELPWHPADCEQCEDRCIVEGEPVLTPDGWKPVESLKKGDCVINRHGETAIIKDAWSKGNTHLVTEIKIEGYGTLKTTDNHRYLTTGGWKEAADLRPGDKIVMPKPANEYRELSEIPFDDDCRIDDYFVGTKGQIIENGRLVHAPDFVQITDNALFVFGYFVGDGFASIKVGKGRFVSVSGHTDTKRIAIERCKKWFDSIGLNHSEYSNKKSKAVEVRAYSGEWAKFFHKHFGQYAAGKELPEFLMNLNERQSRVLLSGLMSSDGYYRKGRYEYITASDKLCSQIARLILRCGYRPTVNKNTTGHHVIAYAESQTDLSAIIQSVCTYFPKRINGRRPLVYDLTTDVTESFVLGLSVVHNCHRIGQADSVQCTYFLGQNTIDEDTYKLIAEKRDMSKQITGAREEVEENVINGVINLLMKSV
jgi:intein/homing endonuclease